MLQLVYVSTAAPGVDEGTVQRILARSRANNARDGITGLLYFDGKRFMQVLEGLPDMVEQALARISGDPRHRAVVTVSRRTIDAREFGAWAMAYGLKHDDKAALGDKVEQLAANAAPSVRGIFQGFLSARRAA